MAERSEDKDTNFAGVNKSLEGDVLLIKEDHFAEVSLPEQDQLLASIGEKKILKIFTFGKTGSGKSSLGSAIGGFPKDAAPKELYGWASNETKPTEFHREVGNVKVVVIDTPGLCDGLQSTNDEETVEKMKHVLNNDCSGVIIICLEMHERMDESTMKPLIDLHQRFGLEIWPHVIIALTKADRYEKEKWLKEKPRGKSKAEYLKCRFAKEVEGRKAYLKAIFTEDRFKSRIRMTQSEYEKLQIPIVSTSQLEKEQMKRMDKVGCKHWFDELLIHCSARDKDVGVLQIHEQRIAHLPQEMINKMEQTLEERNKALFEWVQKIRPKQGKLKKIVSSIFVAWGIFWRTYYQTIITIPQFQAIEQASSATTPTAPN